MRVNSESVSNEIDESDSQFEKHDEERIWIWRGMMVCDSLPKYRINFDFDESKIKYDLTTKCKLSEAIEIEIFEIFENARPSMNWTWRGIVIELREEQK
jgi:hypothetical protein